MHVEIIVKNYRCFSESNPAKITMRDGFIAFVGVNNSGKSTLLKLFFELRDIFKKCKAPGSWPQYIKGKSSFHLPSLIADQSELFCNSNNHDITIEIKVLRSP